MRAWYCMPIIENKTLGESFCKTHDDIWVSIGRQVCTSLWPQILHTIRLWISPKTQFCWSFLSSIFHSFLSHVNHRMIICVLNRFTPLVPYCIRFSVTLRQWYLWNSLSTKKIKPFSSFRQNIKNSVIDGYNSVINSWRFRIILSLNTIYCNTFYLKQLFCHYIPSTLVLVLGHLLGSVISVIYSSMNYLGVPNPAQWT